MRRRFNWDKRYLYWGVTAFCVIAAALLFYFAVSKVSVIGNSFSRLVQILAPFIWGLVISYLLTPLMTSIEKHLFFPLSKKIYKNSKKNTGKGFARGMSVLLSEIVLVLILVALVYLILPQMLSSIQTLIQNSGIYMDNLSAWLDGLFKNYPLLDQYVGDMLESININLGNWLQTTLLPRLGNVVTSVTSGVYGVAKSIYNLIIGIIVSIYLLNDKEGFLAAVKRMSYSVFSVETVERIRIGLNFVDKTFMSFLNGKLLDSFIIGIICYIVCSILQMPYTLLVSVIVGVTNIIPFFGPLIGAVPSALIILMVNPTKCLIFVIFVIILQQIDGNIIGPRILGNSTGITGFWVIFSIILGGGLFGFWGMFLGVPVFVVLYSLANNLIVKKASVRKEELARERAEKEQEPERPQE